MNQKQTQLLLRSQLKEPKVCHQKPLNLTAIAEAIKNRAADNTQSESGKSNGRRLQEDNETHNLVSTIEDCPNGCTSCLNGQCLACDPLTKFDFMNNKCQCLFKHESQLTLDRLTDTYSLQLKVYNVIQLYQTFAPATCQDLIDVRMTSTNEKVEDSQITCELGSTKSYAAGTIDQDPNMKGLNFTVTDVYIKGVSKASYDATQAGVITIKLNEAFFKPTNCEQDAQWIPLIEVSKLSCQIKGCLSCASNAFGCDQCQVGMIMDSTTQECQLNMTKITAEVFEENNSMAAEYQSTWYGDSVEMKNMIWLDLQNTQVFGYGLLQNTILTTQCSDFFNVKPTSPYNIYEEGQSKPDISFMDMTCLFYQYTQIRNYTDPLTNVVEFYEQKGTLVAVHANEEFISQKDSFNLMLNTSSFDFGGETQDDIQINLAVQGENSTEHHNNTVEPQIDEKCPAGCIECLNSYCLKCNPYTTLNFKDNTCDCQLYYNYDMSYTIHEDETTGNQNVDYTVKITTFNLMFQYFKNENYSCSEFFSVQQVQLSDPTIVITESQIDLVKDQISKLMCSIEYDNQYIRLYQYDQPQGIVLHDYKTIISIYGVTSDITQAYSMGAMKISLNPTRFTQACSNKQGQENYELKPSKFLPKDVSCHEPGCALCSQESNSTSCQMCKPTTIMNQENQMCECPSEYLAENVNATTANELVWINIQNTFLKSNMLENVSFYMKCSQIFEFDTNENKLNDSQSHHLQQEFQNLTCVFQQLTYKTTYNSSIIQQFQTLVALDHPSSHFLQALQHNLTYLYLNHTQFHFDCELPRTVSSLRIIFPGGMNHTQPNPPGPQPSTLCPKGCALCNHTTGQCEQCLPKTLELNEQCHCLPEYTTTIQQDSNGRETLRIELSGIGINETKYQNGMRVNCTEIFSFDQLIRTFIPINYEEFECSYDQTSYIDYVSVYIPEQKIDYMMLQTKYNTQIMVTFPQGYSLEQFSMSFRSEAIVGNCYIPEGGIPLQNQSSSNVIKTNCGDSCALCTGKLNPIDRRYSCDLCSLYSHFDQMDGKCHCDFSYNVVYRTEDSQAVQIAGMTVNESALIPIYPGNINQVHCHSVVDFIIQPDTSQEIQNSLNQQFSLLTCMIYNFTTVLDYPIDKQNNLTIQSEMDLFYLNFQGITPQLQEQYLNQTFKIYLKKQAFLQKCVPNSNEKYEIDLTFEMYRSYEECPGKKGCDICGKNGTECQKCNMMTTPIHHENETLCGCQFLHYLDFDKYQSQSNNIQLENFYNATLNLAGIHYHHEGNVSCSKLFYAVNSTNNMTMTGDMPPQGHPFTMLDNITCQISHMNSEHLDYEHALQYKYVIARPVHYTRIKAKDIPEQVFVNLLKPNGLDIYLNDSHFEQDCDSRHTSYKITNIKPFNHTNDTTEDKVCTSDCLVCHQNMTYMEQECDLCKPFTYYNPFENKCQCDFTYQVTAEMSQGVQVGIHIALANFKFIESYGEKIPGTLEDGSQPDVFRVSCQALFKFEYDYNMDYFRQQEIQEALNQTKCLISNLEFDNTLEQLRLTYRLKTSHVTVTQIPEAIKRAYQENMVTVYLNHFLFQTDCHKSLYENYLLSKLFNSYPSSYSHSPIKGCDVLESSTNNQFKCAQCTKNTTLITGAYDDQCQCRFNYDLDQQLHVTRIESGNSSVGQKNQTYYSIKIHTYNLQYRVEFFNKVKCDKLFNFDFALYPEDPLFDQYNGLDCSIEYPFGYEWFAVDWKSHEVHFRADLWTIITVSNITEQLFKNFFYYKSNASHLQLNKQAIKSVCSGSENLTYEIANKVNWILHDDSHECGNNSNCMLCDNKRDRLGRLIESQCLLCEPYNSFNYYMRPEDGKCNCDLAYDIYTHEVNMDDRYLSHEVDTAIKVYNYHLDHKKLGAQTMTGLMPLGGYWRHCNELLTMNFNQNTTNEIRKILNEAFYGLRCQVRDDKETQKVLLNKEKQEYRMSETQILLVYVHNVSQLFYASVSQNQVSFSLNLNLDYILSPCNQTYSSIQLDKSHVRKPHMHCSKGCEICSINDTCKQCAEGSMKDMNGKCKCKFETDIKWIRDRQTQNYNIFIDMPNIMFANHSLYESNMSCSHFMNFGMLLMVSYGNMSNGNYSMSNMTSGNMTMGNLSAGGNMTMPQNSTMNPYYNIPTEYRNLYCSAKGQVQEKFYGDIQSREVQSRLDTFTTLIMYNVSSQQFQSLFKSQNKSMHAYLRKHQIEHDCEDNSMMQYAIITEDQKKEQCGPGCQRCTDFGCQQCAMHTQMLPDGRCGCKFEYFGSIVDNKTTTRDQFDNYAYLELQGLSAIHWKEFEGVQNYTMPESRRIPCNKAYSINWSNQTQTIWNMTQLMRDMQMIDCYGYNQNHSEMGFDMNSSAMSYSPSFSLILTQVSDYVIEAFNNQVFELQINRTSFHQNCIPVDSDRDYIIRTDRKNQNCTPGCANCGPQPGQCLRCKGMNNLTSNGSCKCTFNYEISPLENDWSTYSLKKTQLTFYDLDFKPELFTNHQISCSDIFSFVPSNNFNIYESGILNMNCQLINENYLDYLTTGQNGGFVSFYTAFMTKINVTSVPANIEQFLKNKQLRIFLKNDTFRQDCSPNFNETFEIKIKNYTLKECTKGCIDCDYNYGMCQQCGKFSQFSYYEQKCYCNFYTEMNLMQQDPYTGTYDMEVKIYQADLKIPPSQRSTIPCEQLFNVAENSNYFNRFLPELQQLQCIPSVETFTVEEYMYNLYRYQTNEYSMVSIKVLGMSKQLVQAIKLERISVNIDKQTIQLFCDSFQISGNLNPNFYFDDFSDAACKDGCQSCSSDPNSCDICLPNTNFNYYSGECECKLNYTQGYQKYQQDGMDQSFLYFQVEDVRIKDELITNGGTFDCMQVLDIQAAFYSNYIYYVLQSQIYGIKCIGFQYTYQQPDSSNSSLAQNDRSSLIFLLYNTTTDILAAYKDMSLTIKLKYDKVLMNCIKYGYSDEWIIKPPQSKACDLSCLKCSEEWQPRCDICNPYTQLRKEDGFCGCKPTYEVEMEEINSNRREIYIDILNVQMKQGYSAYQNQVMKAPCTEFFNFTNFRNMTSTITKFVQRDVEYMQCEVQSKEVDDQGRVISNHSQPTKFMFKTKSLYVEMTNITASAFDAFKAKNFDMLFEFQYFEQPCKNSGNQSSFLIDPSTSKQTCGKGCSKCSKSTLGKCELCNPFTRFISPNSCQCRFNYSMEVKDNYYDSALEQEFNTVILTANNLDLINLNLEERYVACNTIFDLVLSSTISQRAKNIIKSAFDYTTCSIKAELYNDYDYQSHQWVQTPIIQVSIFDVSSLMIESFERQYFSYTMKQTIFSQNCENPNSALIIKALPPFKQFPSKCSKGCLECDDMFECKRCSGNLTVFDSLSGQCNCNFKVQVSVLRLDQTKDQSEGVIAIDLTDLQLKRNIIYQDFDEQEIIRVMDLLSIDDIMKSATFSNDQDKEQLQYDLLSLQYGYIINNYEFEEKQSISPMMKPVITTRTFARVYFQYVPQTLIESLYKRQASLYLNPESFVQSNCSYSGNRLKISEMSMRYFWSNYTNFTKTKDCEISDPFGYCIQCNDTFTYYHNITNNQVSCTKVCPFGSFPNHDWEYCKKCNVNCGICSSTKECFDCSPGMKQLDFKINPDNLNSNLKCVDMCPRFSSLNSTTLECINCNQSSCLSCQVNASICTQCEPYLSLRTNGQCHHECPAANQYPDQNGTCRMCQSECGSCQYMPNYCTSCRAGYKLEAGSCVSLSSKICPSGYFKNNKTGICEQCSSGCEECYNATVCTSCEYDQYLLKEYNTTKCVKECSLGYGSFFDADTYTQSCVKCQQNCSTCYVANQMPSVSMDNSDSESLGNPIVNDYNLISNLNQILQCSSCMNGLSLYNNTCLSTCPHSTVQKVDQSGNSYCIDCPMGCQKCSKPDTCDQCYGNLSLLTIKPNSTQNLTLLQLSQHSLCIDSFYEVCPNGTYKSEVNNTCFFCDKGCAKCDSQGQCIEPCSSECGDCIDDPMNCLTCKGNDKRVKSFTNMNYTHHFEGMHMEAFTCIANCSLKGMYEDTITKECQKCSRNCEKCGSEEVCNKCEYGFMMNEKTDISTNKKYTFCDNECMDPSDFPDYDNNTCVKCAKGCEQCLLPNLCGRCSQFTIPDIFNNKCWCDFKYEVYPSNKTNEIYIDTLNLQYKNLTFLQKQNQPFNCNQLFNFEWTNTSFSVDLSYLKCSFAPIYKEEHDMSLKDYSLGLKGDGLRHRIRMSNFTAPIKSRYLAKLLLISLKQETFVQNCDNKSGFKYQINIYEGDYRNGNFTANPPPPADTTLEMMVPEIYLQADKSKLLRCDNVTISAANNTGFIGGMLRIMWDISIRTTSPTFSTSRSDLNRLISTVQQAFEGNMTLVIPSNITEYLIEDVIIKVTIYGTNVKGVQASSQIEISVLASRSYYQFATANLSNSFYVKDGYSINTKVLMPLCPTLSTLQTALPSSVTVYCALFSSTTSTTVLKNDTKCTLGSEDGLENGKTYQVRLYAQPSSLQPEIKANVTIQTLQLQPQCIINNGQQISASAQREILLNASTTNTQFGTYYYMWECKYVSNNSFCSGIQTSIANDPSITLPRNSLKASTKYQFALKIMSAVDLSTIGTCNTTVNTQDEQLSCNVIDMKYSHNNQNQLNYLDSSLLHNFVCQPLSGSYPNLVYSWSLTEEGSSSNMLNNQTTGQVKATGNALQIMKYTLQANKNYELKCLASDSTNCGSQSVVYTTTRKSTFTVNFLVNPTNGTSFSTLFNLTAQKDGQNKIKCEFGYFDEITNNVVIMSSSDSKTLVTENEVYLTQLPSVTNKDHMLTLYAKCVDFNNIPIVYQQNVTLKNATYSSTQQQSITQTIRSSTSLTSSQIVMLANQLSYYSQNMSFESVVGGYLKIATSIQSMDVSKLTSSDLSGISQAVNSMTSQLISNSQLSSSSDVVKAVQLALTRLLNQRSSSTIPTVSTLATTTGTSTTTPSNEYLVIDKMTYQMLFSSVDSMVALTRGDSNMTSTNRELIDGIYTAANKMLGVVQPDEASISQSGLAISLCMAKTSAQGTQNASLSCQTNSNNSTKTIDISFNHDPFFENLSSIIFKGMVVSSSLMDIQTDPSISNYSSDILTLTALAPESTIATSDKYIVDKLNVQNLETPFCFIIPLTDIFANTDEQQKWCMYYDETDFKWRKLEGPSKRLSDELMECCSSHMTMFAVHTVQVDTYYNVEFQKSFIIPTVVILDAFLILMGIIGFFLDRKKLIRIAEDDFSYDESNSIIQDVTATNLLQVQPKKQTTPKFKKHMIVPEDVINSLEQREILKKHTKAEILGIKLDESIESKSETPKRQKNVKANENQMSPSLDESSHIKLIRPSLPNQDGDLHSHQNISNEELNAVQTQNNLMRKSEIFDNTGLSPLELPNMLEIKRSCCHQFIMIMQYYHRLINCFFTDPLRNSRPLRTLATIAQLYIVLLITGILTTYLPDIFIGVNIAICFAVMRVVQIISNLILNSSISQKLSALVTKNMLGGMLFIAALAGGHFLAFYFGMRQMQLKNSINGWAMLFGAMLIIEILVWDFLIMPIVVLLVNKCFPKMFVREIFYRKQSQTLHESNPQV